MVKPDGVQRGLVGEIIGRFERKGFQLRALKLYSTPKEVEGGVQEGGGGQGVCAWTCLSC
jgi:nucleoside diphosphate kinase